MPNSHLLGVPSGGRSSMQDSSNFNGMIDEWAPDALDEKYEETEFKADFTSEGTSPVGSDENFNGPTTSPQSEPDFLSLIQNGAQSTWDVEESLQNSEDPLPNSVLINNDEDLFANNPIPFKEDDILREELKEEDIFEEQLYFSGEMLEGNFIAEDGESEDPDAALARKYNQPSSLTCSRITVGFWSAEAVDLKFLFGRRKIKYEMRANAKEVNMVIEFDFSQISGLEVDTKKKTMKIELSKPPHFMARENGKWVKVSDFTQGNVTLYRRHKIEVESASFKSHMARFFDCEHGLSQLSEIPLTDSGQEPTFLAECVCDWDKENVATIHCDACEANYCDECDEILHRHPNKKAHKRAPYGVSLKKRTKRKKKDRCRCGTGATKGTLGEPCTGNRCPCFGEGRSCSSCGCKNCHNPANGHPEEEESPAAVKRDVVQPVQEKAVILDKAGGV